MKKYVSDGVEFEVPSITLVNHDPMRMRIEEGEFAGIEFAIKNIRMDEEDEALMWYDLETFPDTPVDQIKQTVDNFILASLIEQIERVKNENPSVE